ncbi:MAG: sigma 54-interacting transcriptional regulator, partial [Myxococcales bacterium]|nr:sigma 54-interacting transcriptional regulator [Myxococcales bacterium]
EVGDMPQAMQAKLLRVLQEGELERVGGSETSKVDVRVIAATNKDLEREIGNGKFREDLYFRLNVVQLHSPPLRERKDDLHVLIDAFLEESCRKNGRKVLRVAPDALQRMLEHDYPGNVRELRNLVERLAILCEGPLVTMTDVEAMWPRRRVMVAQVESAPVQQSSTPVVMSAPMNIAVPMTPVPVAAPVMRFQPDKPFRDQVEEAEREIILGALSFTKDNATEAARLLDLERGHFYKKMKSLGLRRAGGETTAADAGDAPRT